MITARRLRNIIQSLLPVQIFICYCFCISGLIVNVIQLLTWLLIRPFHLRFYRQVNYHLATLIWSQLTFLYAWWSDSELIMYGDPNDIELLQHEYAINLVNHRYEIDWLVGWVAAQRMGLLGGTKIVGKRSLSMIPIVGWSWLFTESIFLRRVWESDKKVLERDIQHLVNGYPKNYYFNFLMACEGTRFTEKKRLASMEYARQKNLPELKYHILPRTRGFSLILQGAKGKVTGVYNFMLAFTKDSAPPKFRTLLKGHSCRAQLYIKRIPTSEIPYDDDEKCAEWLQQLFQEKDRIFDHFVQHDTFVGLDTSRVALERNYSDFFIQFFWVLIIGIPSLMWFMKFMWISTWMAKFIFVVIIGIAYFVLQRMINMSVIKTEIKAKKNN